MKRTKLPSAQLDDDALFLRRVRPQARAAPKPKDIYDLVIGGSGPAGLEAAEWAARRGFSVALAERAQLGGNSLNAGSVPSKAIIRTAQVQDGMREAVGCALSAREAAPPPPPPPGTGRELFAFMRRDTPPAEDGASVMLAAMDQE